MMFLYIIGKKTFNCVMQEKFQHFSNIVLQIFYEVFSFLLYLHIKINNLFTKYNALPS